jgi:hypothetical protein
MSQLQKLQQLAEMQKNKNTNTLTMFKDLVCINVGIPSKPYFPKLKDEHGNKLKDDKGNDLRSERATGTQISLVEFGTGKKVTAVFTKNFDLELLKAYKISGAGYDIKSGNMYFLEKDCAIANYE